ncbi:membrane protein DedA with SNARE-associated domain [Amycolatopsis thermophila]|uniref:Membrane protein DedA with SNARE-associated domain n=1 Tax=Amycolatopsis thermophila TaxID=206084 RepID=A0ABU0ER37_9PSEU|nr:membrane protein DedA with SNARE-associated domain [Amycolatopsis thermophila]
MLDALNHLGELLQGTLGSPWLWLIVFAVAGLDALLPFMPSETTVIAVAVLLGTDVPRLALLALIAGAGALAGDCLSHAVGRGAAPALTRWLRAGDQDRYEWARGQVERNTGLLIVAGRYLPGGRVASGLATGSMGVPWARFVALDALGAGIWAVYSVVIGAIGGAGFEGKPAKGLLLSFGIGLLVVGVIEVVRRIRSRHGARLVSRDHRAPEPGAVGGGGQGGAGGTRADVSEVDCPAPRRPPGEGPLLGPLGDRRPDRGERAARAAARKLD